MHVFIDLLYFSLCQCFPSYRVSTRNFVRISYRVFAIWLPTHLIWRDLASLHICVEKKITELLLIQFFVLLLHPSVLGFFFIYLVVYNPYLTVWYTTGYLQYFFLCLVTSSIILVVTESGHFSIVPVACGICFWLVWRRRTCLCCIALLVGGGVLAAPLVFLWSIGCSLSWDAGPFVQPFRGSCIVV
jgi:hypothetical protein